MSLSPEQSKAARGLVRWSQAALARAAGVSLPTIGRFEKGRAPGSRQTVDAIQRAFETAGLRFTPTGVEELAQGISAPPQERPDTEPSGGAGEHEPRAATSAEPLHREAMTTPKQETATNGAIREGGSHDLRPDDLTIEIIDKVIQRRARNHKAKNNLDETSKYLFPPPYDGWTVEQAFRSNCPSEYSDYNLALKNLEKAKAIPDLRPLYGRPELGLIFDPVYPDGQRRLAAGAADKAKVQLLAAFNAHIQAGRCIAVGRLGSDGSTRQVIRKYKWESLDDFDVSVSCAGVSNDPSGVIYSIRIFPNTFFENIWGNNTNLIYDIIKIIKNECGKNKNFTSSAVKYQYRTALKACDKKFSQRSYEAALSEYRRCSH